MSAEEREARLCGTTLLPLPQVSAKNKTGQSCPFAKLQIHTSLTGLRRILHRMYYLYDTELERKCDGHAICLYGPLSFDFNGRKCRVVDTITGITEGDYP